MSRKMHTSFKTSLDDIELEVRATVTPGIRGRLSGRPEDCYPAEPAEIDQIHVFFEDEEIGGKFGAHLISLLDEDNIIERAETDDRDSREDAMVEAYESNQAAGL